MEGMLAGLRYALKSRVGIALQHRTFLVLMLVFTVQAVVGAQDDGGLLFYCDICGCDPWVHVIPFPIGCQGLMGNPPFWQCWLHPGWTCTQY